MVDWKKDVDMKLIQILLLGSLTSCGLIHLPNERIEIDFDMKTTHANSANELAEKLQEAVE